ncbi:MAG: hypothetical protein ACR2IK_06885 [Chloroflexota bacterium]
MPDLVIRVVALLGGLLVGVIGWTALALIMRANALTAVRIDRLPLMRVVLLGLLLLLLLIWLVSPVRGSPWIWPGVIVGVVASALLFRLARAGPPLGGVSPASRNGTGSYAKDSGQVPVDEPP